MCKFLGVIVDGKLKWKEQINEVVIKISKSTSVIYKRRNGLTSECLRNINLSLACPHFLYGAAVWAGHRTPICKVFSSQRKLIRVL